MRDRDGAIDRQRRSILLGCRLGATRTEEPAKRHPDVSELRELELLDGSPATRRGVLLATQNMVAR